MGERREVQCRILHQFQLRLLKLMNRQELQDAYINEVIDGMDIKDMMAVLFDMMDRDLDNYTDAELEGEVERIYPHLLEE